MAEFARDGIRIWFMTVSLSLFLFPPGTVKKKVAYGYHSVLLYQMLFKSTPHRSIHQALVLPSLNIPLPPVISPVCSVVSIFIPLFSGALFG